MDASANNGKKIIQEAIDKQLSGVKDMRQLLANYLLKRGMQEGFIQSAIALHAHIKTIEKEHKFLRLCHGQETADLLELKKVHMRIASAAFETGHELKKILSRMEEINPEEAKALREMNWFEGEPDQL